MTTEESNRQVINTIDIANRHAVAMRGSGSGQRLGMLLPPTRATEWTPEEALVLAAWLVSMAEPFAQVTFEDVLHKVHNT